MLLALRKNALLRQWQVIFFLESYEICGVLYLGRGGGENGDN